MMIQREDYLFLSKFLSETSGLELEDGKEYLLEGRLRPYLDRLGLRCFSELVNFLRKNPQHEVSRCIINAMTTNESLFFRDGTPFRYLQEKILPTIAIRTTTPGSLSIWSTACSTGQEPYSMAISLLESGFPVKSWSIDILATDLCAPVLERAKDGVYTDFEIQRGICAEKKTKYFRPHPKGWQVIPEVRSLVTFRETNLILPESYRGKYDIIFCRNVLIYFSHQRKQFVLDHLRQCLKPGGYLILGGAESLQNFSDQFERTEATSVYKLKQECPA